jgi:MerR family transcriptional regulator, light-induced transcriptional regulator
VTGLDLKDLLELIKPVASPFPGPVKVASEYDTWLSSCLEATRKMDTDALQMLLRSSLASLGLQGFVLERCTVLLEEIGERWAQGSLSVAQEHFAASVLEGILSEQWRSISNVNRGHLCVLATPQGEQHTLGLHMSACLMVMRGVKIIWLGANVPTLDLCETASNLKANYLCLSFSRSFDKQDAEQVLKTIRAKLEPQIALLVGGAGAPLNAELAVRFQGLDALAACFGSVH